MSKGMKFEGLQASAIRATARLLGVSPREAIYIAAVYLGSNMVRSMEDQDWQLNDMREYLRELVDCFESRCPDGVDLPVELERLCGVDEDLPRAVAH